MDPALSAISPGEDVEEGANETIKWVGAAYLYFPLFISLLPYSKKLRKLLVDFYEHESPVNLALPNAERLPQRLWFGLLMALVFTSAPIWLLLYSIDEDQPQTWEDWAQITGFLLIPLAIALQRPPARKPFDHIHVIIICFFLIPLEISRYVTFIPLKTVGTTRHWPDLNITHTATCVLCLFIFTIIQPIHKDLHLDFTYMKISHLLHLAFAAAMFTVVALPIADAQGLVHYKDSNIKVDGFGHIGAIFFLKGLIWVILYHGIFQNLLHQSVDWKSFELEFCPSSVLVGSSPKSNYSYLNEGSENSGVVGASEAARSTDSESAPNGINPDAHANGLLNAEQRRQQQQMEVASNSIGIAHSKRPENFDSIGERVHEPERPSRCSRIRSWLGFGGWKHYLCWFITAVFVACASINYSEGTNTGDVMAYWLILFWLGLCDGWLWFHTKHIVWPSLLYTGAYFVGTVWLLVDCADNSGLCR